MCDLDKAKLERNLLISKLMRIYFAGICMAIPSIVGYWTANGLSFADITLLQACFAAGVVLLEVPSGYFADCMGRKNSIVIAGVFLALGDAAYAISGSFFGFLVAELLLAAAFAFCSGADEAIIRSTLSALGRDKEGEFEKFMGDLNFIGFIAMAASGVIGGIIAQWHPTLPFWTEAFLGLLAFITSLFLVEPNGSIKEGRKMSLVELFDMAKTAYLGNVNLAWLMLYSACINCWIRISVWIYQPYFENSGYSLAEIGLAFTVFNLAAAAGSKFLAPRFAKNDVSWVGLLLAIALAYLCMSLWALPLVAWIFPMVHQVVRGILSVCFSGMLKKEVAEQDFATFGSLRSFGGQLVYASVVPLFGAAVDQGGYESTLISVALIGFAVSFLVLCFKPKRKLKIIVEVMEG